MSLLRTPLLWLSRQRSFGDALERLGPSERLVRRFVAGFDHLEAIDAGRTIVQSGSAITLSRLGEDVVGAADARTAAAEYRTLLRAIGDADLAPQSVVAVKPTLLGLSLSAAEAGSNLQGITEAAQENGVRLELDMERSDTVAATLALYRQAAAYDQTAVALQAYLRRTPADLDPLIADGIARVRLVKGAYEEPPDLALRTQPAIRRAFNKLVGALFTPESLAAGSHLAVATHDLPLIAAARARAHARHVPPDRWEVQLLYGVRPRLQQQLAREHYALRVYLPYGAHWYPYFLRRLAERPANVWFALRSLASA